LGFEITKAQFEALAQEKLDDAKILLAQKRWSNAYYLGGYSVEMALKVCIAKTFKAETLPAKELVNATYTHIYGDLVNTAGLRAELHKALRSTDFSTNWAVVNLWSPDSRYQTTDEEKASAFFAAMEGKNGVFTWIKAFW
jgi:HEPN domain-containing protein